MVFTYSDCLGMWKTDYMIKKKIDEGALYQIEKGIYADVPDATTLAILTKKYPHAIITLDSAFYYHGFTDVIPDQYYLATDKHSIALRDSRIKQIYIQSDIYDVGVMTMERRDATFKIYDRERMLIELLRYKNRLPFDYYKEILGNYRNLLYELDIERIQEYAESFPRSKMISKALELEVF